MPQTISFSHGRMISDSRWLISLRTSTRSERPSAVRQPFRRAQEQAGAPPISAANTATLATATRTAASSAMLRVFRFAAGRAHGSSPVSLASGTLTSQGFGLKSFLHYGSVEARLPAFTPVPQPAAAHDKKCSRLSAEVRASCWRNTLALPYFAAFARTSDFPSKLPVGWRSGAMK